MAYSYGATTLPVTAPSLVEAYTEPVGDPGLGVVLAFAAAVLEYEVGAAWEEVAPGEPLIRHTRPHDPREEDFATSALPALFAYRAFRRARAAAPLKPRRPRARQPVGTCQRV